MKDFIKLIQKLSPLTTEATGDLEDVISEKTYKKGEFIVRQGSICKQFYFINNGLIKLFFLNEDKEFIMRFFSEGHLFTVLDSFTGQTYSSYAASALEPTWVSCISSGNLESLCKDHHCIETAFRKILSMAIFQMMNRVKEMLEEDGLKRYDNFLKTNNYLMQRISLGDLANYLGITQVSLSRIRAKR